VGQVLYARARVVLGDGSVRVTDAVFTATGSGVAAARLSTQLPSVDVSRPFVWSSSPLHQAYRLQIYADESTSDGVISEPIGAALRDSGDIRVPRRFFSDLPLGWYVGRLSTKINGVWQQQLFRFQVTGTGRSLDEELKSARWATTYVRDMADANNWPLRSSLLSDVAFGNNGQANCTDYANTLLRVLQQMGVGTAEEVGKRPRHLYIGFSNYDIHDLVEVWHSGVGKWIIFDPTFDFAVKKSNGEWASSQEVQAATLQKNWGAITYEMGPRGDAVARAYYVDYPLLYLNVPLPPKQQGHSMLPYLERVQLPILRSGCYLARSENRTANLQIQGTVATLECQAAEGFSNMFLASSVLPAPEDPLVEIYQPTRYLF
jgi:hypothetical protein